MRHLIFKLGRIKATISITVFSVLFSVSLTQLIVFLLEKNGVIVDKTASLFIAITAPAIFTPTISWPAICLLFKIHRMEVEMRELATYDHLTGLLNRHAFLERSEHLLCIAQRENLKISIIFVDLDHFKKINDKYGHDGGDKVLTAFGETVKNNLRKSDLGGRIGGEEFALLLPNTSTEQALALSERLHSAIRETPIAYNDHSIPYTVSMGIAAYPLVKAKNFACLLKIADNTLYIAKENGRNQTMVYNPEINVYRGVS